MAASNPETASLAEADDGPAGNGSFWDVGNYKPVLRRINNGAKLCDELVKACHERAAIEKQYAQSLQKWADRWNEKLDRINEFGTLKDGWRGMLIEAKEAADAHIQVKERLENEMKYDIETWKKQHYPKSLIHYKAWKRANSAFEKAQNPWAKRKLKVVKYKTNLDKTNEHAAQCRAKAKEGNGDVTKLEAQAKKDDEHAMILREKLRRRVQEMLEYKSIYRQEMMLEYNRCQDEEKVRIEFFKQALYSFHARTTITPELERIHNKLRTTVDAVNSDADLQRFSREFGCDMPMVLPNAVGVFHPEGVDPPSYDAPPPSGPPPASVAVHPSAPAPAGGGGQYPPNTKLIAMYDYVAQKPDELSFSYDDPLWVVAGPAEPDWVRCRNESGQTGIVPANYVDNDVDA